LAALEGRKASIPEFKEWSSMLHEWIRLGFLNRNYPREVVLRTIFEAAKGKTQHLVDMETKDNTIKLEMLVEARKFQTGDENGSKYPTGIHNVEQDERLSP
jgi:hypothetical protein